MSEADTRTIETVARDALKSFAAAIVTTCAPIAAEAFGLGEARDGAGEVAEKTREILTHDLSGTLVSSLDTQGLKVGSATVKTDLAAFAQGKASSPIASVSADTVKNIDLPPLDTKFGSVTTSCTLTLHAVYGRGDANEAPSLTTTAKVALNVEYTSPDLPAASTS